MQYARTVSDSTLKQKGNYDDSIRINRKNRRKLKTGKLSPNHFLCLH